MSETDFCARIRQIRESITPQLSRKAMAEKWPWHENSIKGYEKDRLPDVDYLLALSIESGHDFMELVNDRIKSGILAGNPLLKTLDKLAGDFGNTLEVTDDAMLPTFGKGSLVFYDPSSVTLEEGKVFLFDFNGRWSARRVQFIPTGDLLLISDNPKFSDVTVPQDKVTSIKCGGLVRSVKVEL